ncbi:type II toxin-antitoxin system VapC family toxin [Armatimonas sp.]|uniref:type II toxin-antitoxin system VapC family toxin n=1 Tax=Armatimonas sp. TaxID=1872638 RepID=UPI00374D11E9
MNLLLDTHTFLWFVTNDPLRSEVARTRLEDSNSTLYLSIASIWEMSIKHGIGKLPFAQPIEIFIPAQLQVNRIDILPITQEHAFHAGQLPMHHRDPFDRMLIAQSIVEAIPLVSADTSFVAYTGLTQIW